MKKFLSFVRTDLGQSIVELALAMPILVYLLVGGDMARAFAVQIAVQNGPRAENGEQGQTGEQGQNGDSGQVSSLGRIARLA